ncbi:ATPase [Bacillus thuringiensis]|uniref:ATPase n=1 Tax=Bacillus thuringiensis TaxID=1428 RepID=UPI000BED8749|nr:ATPase [Bacillus thuringiensis]HDR4552865.1 ATPase [Bacillus cereus]MED3313840.1 ATPase [Bacillus thuringiensis]PDY60230.1 ATPase [Bacillus thuringiensis]PDZ65846.1 ATPase [Bacillus thuringiensis]PER39691.1 ATPase [Bacillus thuringiensis]
MNIKSASGSGGMNLTHDTLASMGGIVSLVNMLLGGLFGLGPTVKFLTKISLSYLIKTG